MINGPSDAYKNKSKNKNILEVFAMALGKCIPASIYIALSASKGHQS